MNFRTIFGNWKISLITLAIVALLIVVAFAVYKVTFPSVGTVKAIRVGVYKDAGCTEKVSSIDWGVVESGTTKNINIYVRNEGNVPEIITMTVENWNPPAAPTYVTISLDIYGQVLSANEVRPAVISVSVSSEVSGVNTFSCDITIVGDAV